MLRIVKPLPDRIVVQPMNERRQRNARGTVWHSYEIPYYGCSRPSVKPRLISFVAWKLKWQRFHESSLGCLSRLCFYRHYSVFVWLLAGLRKKYITDFQKKICGKVAREPRKKPLDFGGNPDHVTSIIAGQHDWQAQQKFNGTIPG